MSKTLTLSDLVRFTHADRHILTVNVVSRQHERLRGSCTNM